MVIASIILSIALIFCAVMIGVSIKDFQKSAFSYVDKQKSAVKSYVDLQKKAMRSMLRAQKHELKCILKAREAKAKDLIKDELANTNVQLQKTGA